MPPAFDPDILTALFLAILLLPALLKMGIFIYQTFFPQPAAPTITRDPLTGVITVHLSARPSDTIDVTNLRLRDFEENRS